MVEECDIDCQQKGSQLTSIAFLMIISYSMVILNSIIMCLGSIRFFFRICATLCSMFFCCGQIVIQFMCISLLFT